MKVSYLMEVGADAKTVKGEKIGVMTGIMYLAPHKLSGINVCPMAELAGCVSACLNTAGRGRMSGTQRARVNRTTWFHEDKPGFLRRLRKDMNSVIRKANRAGMTPMFRLNGTSDIRWELEAPELFEEYSDYQFYDYTKLPNRKNLPNNYHLTFSYSGSNARYRDLALSAVDNGMNLAVVFRDALPDKFLNLRVIDGDLHDVRPLDPKPSVVGLVAKGDGKKDQSGFVVDS